MTAKSLTLRLVLPPDFDRASALDAARTFLSMMPQRDGQAAGPLFEPDETRLRAERDDKFEAGSTAIALSNSAVLPEQGWYGTLYFLASEDGSQMLFTSMLGGSGFPQIWSYMLEVARASVDAFDLRLATLGGISASASPLAVLREVHVPRVFAPWNFVSLRGLSPELVAALRGLPDCSIEQRREGLIIVPVADAHAPPSESFVAALEQLPITPKATYRHLTFPRPRKTTSAK